MQIHDLISRAIVYKADQLLLTAMKIAALKPLITLGFSSTPSSSQSSAHAPVRSPGAQTSGSHSLGPWADALQGVSLLQEPPASPAAS